MELNLKFVIEFKDLIRGDIFILHIKGKMTVQFLCTN